MPLAELLEEDVQIEISTEDLFTGRKESIEKFHKLYDSMKTPEKKGHYEVMLYYGLGGIGKSSLIKKICREVAEKTDNKKVPNYAYFTFEGNATKEEFMFSLSRQMMMYNKDLEFFFFDTALAKVAAAEGKSLEKYEEKAKASIMSNSFFDAALSIGGQFVPALETVAKTVNAFCQFAKNRMLAKEREKLENTYKYNEIMDSTGDEIKEKLTEYFRLDVQSVMLESKQPYVVFIDGYENYLSYIKYKNRIEGMDEWLSKELVNIPNVLWVVSGREPLGWEEEKLPKEYQCEIKDLQENEVIEYFRKAKITNEELAKELYKLTNGTPVYMNLCRSTYYAVLKHKTPTIDDFGKNTSELVERYMKNMNENDSDMMILLSYFPKVWDMDMAKQVVDKLGYDFNRVQKLVKLSMFTKIDDKYKMNEMVKNAIRSKYKGESQEKIWEVLLEYYANNIIEKKQWNYSEFVEVFKLCEKKVVSDDVVKEIMSYISNDATESSEEQFRMWGIELLSDIENVLIKCAYLPETILKCLKYKADIFTEQKWLEYNVWDKCIETIDNIHKMEMDIHGENSLEPFKTLNNFANKCYDVKKFTMAKKYFLQVKEAKERILECNDMIDILWPLVKVYVELYEFDNAKEMYEQVLNLLRQGMATQKYKIATIKNEMEEMVEGIINSLRGKRNVELFWNIGLNGKKLEETEKLENAKKWEEYLEEAKKFEEQIKELNKKIVESK